MFITFEGPEGSGKTSHIPALARLLRKEGFDVLTCREPGGTAIGDQIRTVLFSMENNEMGARTETLLFQAARAQLIDQVILPHLHKGGVVISDRYADSTLAYQGYGRGLDLDLLRIVLEFTTGRLKPDLTILLDVDVDEGLRRKKQLGEWNRLDATELAFHQRVRQGYQLLAREEPHRWRIIDAGRCVEQVQEDIGRVVLEQLKVKRET